MILERNILQFEVKSLVFDNFWGWSQFLEFFKKYISVYLRGEMSTTIVKSLRYKLQLFILQTYALLIAFQEFSRTSTKRNILGVTNMITNIYQDLSVLSIWHLIFTYLYYIPLGFMFQRLQLQWSLSILVCQLKVIENRYASKYKKPHKILWCIVLLRETHIL